MHKLIYIDGDASDHSEAIQGGNLEQKRAEWILRAEGGIKGHW